MVFWNWSDKDGNQKNHSRNHKRLRDEKAIEYEESNIGGTYCSPAVDISNSSNLLFTFSLERLLKCLPFTIYLCVDTEVEDISEMLDIGVATFMTTKHLLSCEGACDYSKLENEIKTKFGAWCAKKKIYFVITTTSRSFTLSKALVSAFFLKRNPEWFQH